MERMARVFWLFALGGGAFAVSGVGWGARELWFGAHAAHADGVVVALNDDRDSEGERLECARVRYAVNGGEPVEFQDPLCTNFGDLHVGDAVPVLFDRANPARAEIDRGGRRLWVPGIFAVVGLGFATIGTVVLTRIRRRRRLDAWLRANGVRVRARLVGAERRRISVQGETPWRVRAEWTDPADGRTHTFLSDSIWKDPTPRLASVAQIDVLIDPADPRRHCVELERLRLS
jgi:hypothetical protein